MLANPCMRIIRTHIDVSYEELTKRILNAMSDLIHAISKLKS